MLVCHGLGNTTMDPTGSDVEFSFIGRKGPLPAPAAAPFQVGVPANVFLNNAYCWPLVHSDPSSGDVSNNTQQLLAVAQPLLDNTPQDLQVGYMPIEMKSGGSSDPSSQIFAKTFTQFYFRCGAYCANESCTQYCIHGTMSACAGGQVQHQTPIQLLVLPYSLILQVAYSDTTLQ